MIHLIAGKGRDVEAEDETRLGCCWEILPSKGANEAGDSRADCAGARVHVGQGRVEKHESGAGVNRNRWNANS
jgi:hypothetical protein